MNCQSRLRSTTPAKLGSFDQLQAEIGGDLGALHLLGRIVEEQRDLHRRADLRKMLEHHRGRRRPVIRRGGDDGGGPLLLRVAGAGGRDGGAGLARVGDHGHAAAHLLDRKFHERATLVVGQARDSPACMGSASASAPLRRWKSISLA